MRMSTHFYKGFNAQKYHNCHTNSHISCIYIELDTDFYFLMHNYRENASLYVEDKKIMSGYYYFRFSHS